MKRSLTCLIALTSAMTASQASADTYEVPGDHPTIQAAWDAIPNSGGPGWYILVAPGTYQEALDLSGKTAWIIGTGKDPGDVVVDSSTQPGVASTVHVENAPFNGGPFLERLTLTGGNGHPASFFTYGGGVYLAPSGGIRMDNCVVGGNSAFYGGGIYASNGASVTLYDCVVEDNTAGLGGGLAAGHYVTVTDSTLRDNSALRGGNILLFAENQHANITNTVIRNGTATGQEDASSGGGVYLLDHGSVTFRECQFTENSADNNGGAIVVEGEQSPADDTDMELIDCTFIGNSAGWVGGAIDFDHPGNLLVQDTSFHGNQASRGGGACALTTVNATFEADCTFSGNAIAPDTGTGFRNGGAIFALEAELLSIDEVDFNANNAVYYGGAIYANNTPVTINRSNFAANDANSRGDAIYATAFSSLSMDDCEIRQHDSTALYASLTSINLDQCTFLDNRQGFIGGGAIDLFNEDDSAAPSTINDCIFRNNESGDRGAAICVDDWALAITETTFESNTVGGPNQWRGGAIFGELAALRIDGCTFQQNRCSGDGGSIAIQTDSSLNLSNSQFLSGVASEDGGEIHIAWDTIGAALENCTFEGSTAGNHGGAISNHKSGVTMEACIIKGCSSNGNGGGVDTTALMPIKYSTICSNLPDQVTGNWSDIGGNLIGMSCDSCPMDLNGDNMVNGADLGLMIGSWGACKSDPCLGDLNGDGQVDGADLGMLIGSWGNCL